MTGKLLSSSRKERSAFAWRRLAAWACLVLLVLFSLFVANAATSNWSVPVEGTTTHPARHGTVDAVKVMANNIRWCRETEDCLRRLVELTKRVEPDLVFVTAVFYECSICRVSNQVAFLAEETGMHGYAFGENYNWGFPYFRLRSGNAVLSRFPLTGLATEQLSGGEPWFQLRLGPPSGNRRVLWAEVEIGGATILVGALHNDSSDMDNNLVQMRQILNRVGDRPALLGGDFNAEPGTPPMLLLHRSGQFSGAFDGERTYPAERPDRRLDYVLAPRSWELVTHDVLTDTVSAHLPVVSTFRVPP